MLSLEELAKRQQELALKRELRRRQRRINRISVTLLVILGILLMSFSAIYSYRHGLKNQQAVTNLNQSQTSVSLDPQEYRRTHILFLGMDDKGDASSRTDTILFIAADPSSGSVGIISIPRDTRVYIPERNRYDRINAAHVYGGPELTVKVVEQFLGVNIDYYIQTDFVGFSKIVDTLGGVEIDVKKDMVYTDTAQGLYINLKAGKQILDGDKALQYVRYRDQLGDVALVNPQYDVYGGRVARQREFLMAIIDKALHPSTILKLPRLLGQVWDAVDTNIPWTVALKFALAADRFTMDKVETAIVPGNSDKLNGAWYWIADEKATADIVNWIVYGIPLPLTAEVLNGCGIAGIAGKVAELISDEVDVRHIGNAERFDYPVSEIIVGSKKDADRLIELANKLNAELLIDPFREKPVDVTIIIGQNYQTL